MRDDRTRPLPKPRYQQTSTGKPPPPGVLKVMYVNIRSYSCCMIQIQCRGTNPSDLRGDTPLIQTDRRGSLHGALLQDDMTIRPRGRPPPLIRRGLDRLIAALRSNGCITSFPQPQMTGRSVPQSPAEWRVARRRVPRPRLVLVTHFIVPILLLLIINVMPHCTATGRVTMWRLAGGLTATRLAAPRTLLLLLDHQNEVLQSYLASYRATGRHAVITKLASSPPGTGMLWAMWPPDIKPDVQCPLGLLPPAANPQSNVSAPDSPNRCRLHGRSWGGADLDSRQVKEETGGAHESWGGARPGGRSQGDVGEAYLLAFRTYLGCPRFC